MKATPRGFWHDFVMIFYKVGMMRGLETNEIDAGK
jgi:hypothetical protein